MSRNDLADFGYFLAIARHRSFRLAGIELGVSASALSHALKGLENRLGVRLLNRTNRSVTLTAAGEELRESIAGPFDAIGEAADRLNRYRDTPSGSIRLNVPADAMRLVLAPVLPIFADRYPDIQVEVEIAYQLVDMIAEGFDAGIRHGGTVPEDMIAQRLSPELRWVVAASPAYLERYGRPRRPSDLKDHQCIGVRLGNEHIYRWEFNGADGEFAMDVPSRIITSNTYAVLDLALAGAGLLYEPEPLVARHVADGTLELVLEDFAVMGEAYQLYHPSRRQVPTGLRLLIELIREQRPLG